MIITTLVLMLGPQIWAMYRAKGAFFRLVLLTVSTCLTVFVMLLGPNRVTMLSPSPQAYSDTYYVVARVQVLLAVGLLFAGFMMLVYVATRKAGMLPKMGDVLASLLALNLTETLLRLHYLPLALAISSDGLPTPQGPAPLAVFIRLMDVAFWATLLALVGICVMVLLRRPA